MAFSLVLGAALRWFAWSAGVLAFACDNKDAPTDTEPSGTRDNTMSGGDASYALRTTLSIGSNPLTPGEVTFVGVRVDPPGPHDVLIALTQGGELAFLHDSVLVTDSTGYAETKLTVSRTGVGNVVVQALVVGAAPEYFEAVIEAPGEATLNVVPVYAGERAFTEWHVAVIDDPTCPTDFANFIDIDHQTFERAPQGEPLYLRSVPTGRPVSVLVRAEEYAFGCTPGVVVTNDTSQSVSVNVTDEPLVVEQLAFPMRFGVYANSEPFWGEVGAYLATLGQAFRGEFAADSVALLSRMEQLASDPEAFRTNRQARTWDTLLEVRLTAAGASQGLTSRVQRWLLDGAQLLQSQTALQANVEAKDAKLAALELTSVAGLAPAALGVKTTNIEASLTTSGTDDFVRLAFSLEFEPSRLFGGLAAQVINDTPPFEPCEPPEVVASDASDAGVTDAGVPDTSAPNTGLEDALASLEGVDGAADANAGDAGLIDPPSALAAIVGCTSVGLWLSEDTGYAYEGCDATCAKLLCEQAIDELWQQVLTKDTEVKTLQVSAAGRAALNATADVIGLTAGEWIGTTNLFQDGKTTVGTLQGCAGSLTRSGPARQ